MKFNSSSKTWSRGISAVKNAVGSAVSTSIVENIYVSARENQILFRATNLNLTIQCYGEGEIYEEGDVLIPAKLIDGIVRDLPKDDVSFEFNKKCLLKCGKYNARINGLAAGDFPDFQPVSEDKSIRLDVEKFKDVIRKVVIASTTEKSRYELDGVKFEIEINDDGGVNSGRLNLISTDGRRLALYRIDGVGGLNGNSGNGDVGSNGSNQSNGSENSIQPDESENPIQPKNLEPLEIMVPSESLRQAINVLPDEGEVTISFENRRIQFSCEDVQIISNLLVLNFPDWKRIVPKLTGKIAKINRDDFASAIKRTSHLINESNGMLVLNFGANEIELHGENEDSGGEGNDSIVAEYDGEPMQTRFHYRYLLDFLRVVDDEDVVVDLSGERKPAVFMGFKCLNGGDGSNGENKGDGNGGDSKGEGHSESESEYQYVAMPMKPPGEE